VISRTTADLEERVIAVAFFIPLAMLFISWFVPISLKRGVELGKVEPQDAQATADLARRVRRVSLLLLLIPAGMVTGLLVHHMT